MFTKTRLITVVLTVAVIALANRTAQGQKLING